MIRPLTFYFQRKTIVRGFWLTVSAGLLLTTTVHAQAPTVTNLSPVRNARTAPRNTNVTVGFSQALSNTPATLGSLKVFSQQAGGKKAGTATVSGNTLSFNPTIDFKAGETVFGTVTAAAQSSNGAAAIPHIFEFTTATAPSTGRLAGGSEIGLTLSNTDVALGDLDGDGDLDIISCYGTSDPIPGVVVVRLNDGNGYFTNGQDVRVGTNPGVNLLADVDNDGDLDVLTANFGGSVSVLLNNGSGAYARGQNLMVAGAPLAIVLADLDGDGDLDFATANGLGSTGTVNIRLNNGNGTFSGTTSVTTGFRSNGAGNGLAASDVDGDGDLDLLTSYLPSSTNINNGLVGVLRNNGSASFTVTQQVTTPPFPYEVALGDVDNDGDLDMLVEASGRNSVLVRLNNGSGNFTGFLEVAVGNNPIGLALGDLDGDGDLDLVTANSSLNRDLSVRLNDGQGNFSGTQNITLPSIPYGVRLGDVDGDGDLDLAAVRRDDGGVNVYLNNGSSLFTAAQFVFVDRFPLALAFGDVDNDGTVDLLTANSVGQTVSVRLNKEVLANAPAQLTEQVSLYPNPAHGTVRLRLPAELAQQRLQVSVLNTLGQVVLTQTLAAQTTPELALPRLAAGLYTLQLQTSKGVVAKRLAVK